MGLECCELVGSCCRLQGAARDLFRLVRWAGELFGVGFAFAAEVDDFFAGEKGPVGDDSGGGGTLHELGVADRVGLRAANGCDEFG